MPKEAIFSCTGLAIEDLIIDVENVLPGIHFHTEQLNMVELASVMG